jgi:hypothetical protein
VRGVFGFLVEEISLGGFHDERWTGSAPHYFHRLRIARLLRFQKRYSRRIELRRGRRCGRYLRLRIIFLSHEGSYDKQQAAYTEGSRQFEDVHVHSFQTATPSV